MKRGTMKNRLRTTVSAFLLCAIAFHPGLLRAADAPAAKADTLKVAVYNALAPFSDKGQGIDADLASALARKLGLKLRLLSFNAGDDLN